MLSDLSYRHQHHQLAWNPFQGCRQLPRPPSFELKRPDPPQDRTPLVHLAPPPLSRAPYTGGDLHSPGQREHHACPPPEYRTSPILSCSDEHSTSENMLRRKTPSGTLAAGYDGSLSEWTSKPHAMKHLLMPLSRSVKGAESESRSSSWSQQLPLRGTDKSYAARASMQIRRSHPYQTIADQKFVRMEPNRTKASGAMDSVLNQSPINNLPFNTAAAPSAPIAMQPMWPPFPSPTSSQTTRQLGEGWLNSDLGPRDHALHSAIGNVVDTCPSTSSAMLDPSIMRAETKTRAPAILFAGQCQAPLSLYHTPGPQEQLVQASPPGTLPLAFDAKMGLGGERPLKMGDGFANDAREDGRMSNAFDWQPPQGPSRRVDFKERVLGEAHGIYRCLLVVLERNRREQYLAGAQAAVPPSRTPLPKRPYPSWTNTTHSGCYPAELHAASETQSYRLKQGHAPPGIFCPPGVSSRSCMPGEQSHSSRRLRHPRLVSRSLQGYASYVPNQLIQDHQLSNQPATAASSALETLSRLSQESHWQWIDGMLLSGCLAFGLGDHLQATRWFSRVLERDAENAEAMSNLAATFLAQGRRGEAEQLWTRAVQSRPSYFEAVEHFVGFLQEENRGREAVQIITHVETALRNEIWKGGAFQGQSFATNWDYRNGLYVVRPSDNGRLLALIHGKGNILYQAGDNDGAAHAFEDAIMTGAGPHHDGIRGLIGRILKVFVQERQRSDRLGCAEVVRDDSVLLPPEAALETSRLVFPPHGNLPGLADLPQAASQKAAVSIISNSLLSLAKIYQDGMSSSGASAAAPRSTAGVKEILALYYLSLSLQPSPSTANNVGILLAGVQQSTRASQQTFLGLNDVFAGVVPGSGVALALAYYDYGLKLDARHAHLYTNLGSLFKDIGQLPAAIKMYEKAVECDGGFDIALANLANAVKDKGNIRDAIQYYRRAVASNPDFAEAVCGLANALNSVCSWSGRGGVGYSNGKKDRWHVDEQGMLYDSRDGSKRRQGWIEQVVAIVERQLRDGRNWGQGILHSVGIDHLLRQLPAFVSQVDRENMHRALGAWAYDGWEGAKVVRLIERATKVLVWQIFRAKYHGCSSSQTLDRTRPRLPAALAVPSAPTVLPFHTFTCPLQAKHIRQISQRNGLRVSCSTLRAPWLPGQVYEPPAPPDPQLVVGYVSSDFNNHPLAHLMQSVFGFHDAAKIHAICYATTTSDGSVHRHKIEQESPGFHDASSWSTDELVNQVVRDGVHILVNLNGYTRGAKNEVFAARPAPIQMSFMGFAGTLGAEWCDYLLADEIAIPPATLRPYRANVSLDDQIRDSNNNDDLDEWIYGENVIFTRDTFFCCDHRQSAPDSKEDQLDWAGEQERRWKMRKELFPSLADDTVILGNFNQLYKVGFSC